VPVAVTAAPMVAPISASHEVPFFTALLPAPCLPRPPLTFARPLMPLPVSIPPRLTLPMNDPPEMLIALGKSAGRFRDAGANRHVRSVQADFGLCPQRTDALRQERMGARAKVMGTDCPHVRIRDRRNGVEDIVHLAGIRLGTTDQMPLLDIRPASFGQSFSGRVSRLCTVTTGSGVNVSRRRRPANKRHYQHQQHHEDPG
jgi:hypothetical protein